MSLGTLLAPFRAIADDPLGDWVDEASGASVRAIGYTCSYLPVPLLSVAGLTAVRLRAPGSSGTPMADTYLSSVACPYVRALLEQALEGRFDRLDGWVFAASCDHARRLHDNLVHLLRPAFAWVVDVPHRCDEAATAFYREELERLATALGEHFGTDFSRAALRRAIAEHNEQRAMLAELGTYVHREGGALCGADFHTVLVAARTRPVARIREPLAALLGALEGAPAAAPPRARLLVVGSGIDEPRYMAAIESEGARIVGDRHCAGSLPGLEPIPTEGDPIATLAETTLSRTECPRMMERFTDRLAHLEDAARRHRADGIVIVAMKFCDLWGVEAALLVPALRERGWPVLRLEREYAHGAEGQLRTRVQAFLESMGR